MSSAPANIRQNQITDLCLNQHHAASNASEDFPAYYSERNKTRTTIRDRGEKSKESLSRYLHQAIISPEFLWKANYNETNISLF